MKIFKNIAVAIDFSASSTNTYNYARLLATRFRATLTVVHVYDPLVYDYLTMPTVAEIEGAAKERLSLFVHEDEDNSDTLVATRVKVQTKALMGAPADTLIDYSKDPETDLLILGTRGEHDFVDKLLGSVAIRVVQEAHCPVLLVPKDAEYKGFHHTLYAASIDSAYNKEVDNAIDFAEYFISALHFIHVTAVFKNPNDETTTLFKRILAQKTPRLPYFIENVVASTIAEGINNYCLTHPVDLIMTVTHQRGIWENLIHYSATKELAWQARLPILCLHSDKK